MDSVKKNRFFDLLVEVGLKEIEIGFPAAGATEFDFISGLVRSGRIPDDVVVQVLTQSREDLIRTSFESLSGARAAIVHPYNAVSTHAPTPCPACHALRRSEERAGGRSG